MLEFIHQLVTCNYFIQKGHHVTKKVAMRTKCTHRFHDYSQLKKLIMSMDHRNMYSCIWKYIVHSKIMTSNFQEI